MKVEVDHKIEGFDLADAKIGDVVIVTKAFNFPSPISLLRIYQGWVSLENPANTWDPFSPGQRYGTKLPKRSKITLTVE